MYKHEAIFLCAIVTRTHQDIYLQKHGCYAFFAFTLLRSIMLLRDLADIMLRTTIAVLIVSTAAVGFASFYAS